MCALVFDRFSSSRVSKIVFFVTLLPPNFTMIVDEEADEVEDLESEECDRDCDAPMRPPAAATMAQESTRHLMV